LHIPLRVNVLDFREIAILVDNSLIVKNWEITRITNYLKGEEEF